MQVRLERDGSAERERAEMGESEGSKMTNLSKV